MRFEKCAGLVPERVAVAEARPEPPADPMAGYKDDPLIRKALAEFKARVVAES